MKTHVIYCLIIAALLVLLFTCNRCSNQIKKIFSPDSTVLKIDTTMKRDSSTTGWYKPQPEWTDSSTAAFMDWFLNQYEGGKIPAAAQKKNSVQWVFDTTSYLRPGLFTLDSGSLHWIVSSGIKADTTPQTTIVWPPIHDSRFTIHFYSDTVKTKYGNVIIRDSVTGSINARNVSTDFTIPEVTKTIEQKKLHLYGGIDIYGNKSSPLKGFGFSAALHFKNSMIYEGGVMRLGGETIYKAGVKKIIF